MAVDPLEARTHLLQDVKSLTDLVRLVLRRIVRLLIGTVSFPALVDMLKSIYVEEAEKKLQQDQSKVTMSALALLTGLDTRVVSNIRKGKSQENNIHQNICPEYGLLDMWANDPFFQDDEGNPAVLPIEGKGRTFQTLVLRSIGRNITVKPVLDRLSESGNIRRIEGATEKVEFLSLFYLPISNDRAKLSDIALLEASRVISTVTHNMDAPEQYRIPQQGRWTYRLDPEQYDAFCVRARALLEKQIKEGEELLEEFEGSQKKPGQLTVGISWYQWGGHESNEGD